MAPFKITSNRPLKFFPSSFKDTIDFTRRDLLGDVHGWFAEPLPCPWKTTRLSRRAGGRSSNHHPCDLTSAPSTGGAAAGTGGAFLRGYTLSQTPLVLNHRWCGLPKRAVGRLPSHRTGGGLRAPLATGRAVDVPVPAACLASPTLQGRCVSVAQSTTHEGSPQKKRTNRGLGAAVSLGNQTRALNSFSP